MEVTSCLSCEATAHCPLPHHVHLRARSVTGSCQPPQLPLMRLIAASHLWPSAPSLLPGVPWAPPRVCLTHPRLPGLSTATGQALTVLGVHLAAADSLDSSRQALRGSRWPILPREHRGRRERGLRPVSDAQPVPCPSLPTTACSLGRR